MLLVVVTKTRPVRDIRILADLGVRDVGESRHQEAEPKVEDATGLDLRWHFVGQVQSNKAAAIARYADVVHSVQTGKVVDRLSSGAVECGRTIGCFIQVKLDDTDTPAQARAVRGGVDLPEMMRVADAIWSAPPLSLLGVMGIAPLGADPRAAFELLAEHSRRLRAEHPGAAAISAGMSGDFEAAVEAGATHVRVGAVILGRRPPLG